MATLEITRGATERLRTVVTPTSLTTGSTIYFMAKRYVTDVDAEVVISKASTGTDGIVVTSAGEFVTLIDPGDTRILDNRRQNLVYEIEIEKAGELYPVDSGTLTIKPELIQRSL